VVDGGIMVGLPYWNLQNLDSGSFLTDAVDPTLPCLAVASPQRGETGVLTGVERCDHAHSGKARFVAATHYEVWAASGRYRRIPGQQRRARQAITGFPERSAGQNEQDYQDVVRAVRSGRLEAREGV
jgi:hypothetical protein